MVFLCKKTLAFHRWKPEGKSKEMENVVAG
jgi:hypothetical protein